MSARPRLRFGLVFVASAGSLPFLALTGTFEGLPTPIGRVLGRPNMSIHSPDRLADNQRIVITGVGLTSPNGDNLADFRAALLAGKSGVTRYEIRYVVETLAGVCKCDALRYQAK